MEQHAAQNILDHTNVAIANFHIRLHMRFRDDILIAMHKSRARQLLTHLKANQKYFRIELEEATPDICNFSIFAFTKPREAQSDVPTT